MKCPTDGSDLVMTERQGIEIDYCPQCRGVWLDRGELDKIIERAAQPPAQQSAPQQPAPRQPAFSQPAAGPFTYPERQYDPRRYDDDDDRYKHGHRHRKRKGFLGELFDFD